jgi:hypothetical protein
MATDPQLGPLHFNVNGRMGGSSLPIDGRLTPFHAGEKRFGTF